MISSVAHQLSVSASFGRDNMITEGLEEIKEMALQESNKAKQPLLKKLTHIGYSGDACLKRLLDYMRNAPIVINIRSQNLEKIVESAQYRSSRFPKDNDRIWTEKRLYKFYDRIRNNPPNNNTRYGPIYAALNANKFRLGLSEFGRLMFVLSDNLRDEVTVCYGDTIYGPGGTKKLGYTREIGTLNHMNHILLQLSEAQLKKLMLLALGERKDREKT